MTISVVINTYNAELYLAKVLDSAKSFDEIVICDMESTDRTRSIAEGYGCKIVTFPKGDCKSAEPARTFAIQSASSEWVLVVDADEIITPELRDYLYAHIAKPDCPALYIPRKNHFFGHFLKSFYPDYQLRFFRREGTVWPPHVHTFPKVEGPVDYIPKKMTELAFVHLDASATATFERMNRYSDQEVEKRKGTHVSLASLILKPMVRFFKFYILKGGFLEGKVGFIKACNSSMYKYMALVKIAEGEELSKSK